MFKKLIAVGALSWPLTCI